MNEWGSILLKYSGPFESGVFPWCIHAGTLLVGGGVSHLNSGKSGSPCMSTFQHSIATDFGPLGPPWRFIFASSLAMIDIIDSIHRAVSLHLQTPAKLARRGKPKKERKNLH